MSVKSISSVFMPQHQDALPVLTCSDCPNSGSEIMLFCDFCAAATFGALEEYEKGFLRTMGELADLLAQIADMRKKNVLCSAEEVNAFFDRRREN
jgi:hypothetical protein